jgi:formate--tetrahydrofolate ligase
MTAPRPLAEVAADLGLSADALIPFGRDKAKIDPALVPAVPGKAPGKVVLVSAITPTPAGEGKTTTSIGLVQALHQGGRRAVACLREPSLGPVFGMKGGGTGGGRCHLEPRADVNLHFTGDLHAITAAHNLLAAVVDNHLHFRLSPPIDPGRVRWKRVLDIADRSLRDVVVGLGGDGVPRQASFDITAASEVMAALCLARGADDLRARLGRLLVGLGPDRAPVTAGELGAVGGMMALLRDALLPNLVMTTEGAPALVHGGPFANIAHGCNSVIATRLGRQLADVVVTEAGFAFDLGGEKFMHLKAPAAGIEGLAAVVLVVTVRALAWHGHGDLGAGLDNLHAHLDNIAAFGQRAVVAINRFPDDAPADVDRVIAACAARGVEAVPATHFADGGAGARALAAALAPHLDQPEAPIRPVAAPGAGVAEQVEQLAVRLYGADGVAWSEAATAKLKGLGRLGADRLPVCMAKTQSSLSDDPARRGRPRGFTLQVRDLEVSAGAGFVVVLTGALTRMPGLPKRPRAWDIDLVDGQIVGVG